MGRRAAFTLLYFSPVRLIRADFGSRGELLDTWDVARPDVDDPGLLVEVALSPGPKPARKVWALSVDVWTNHLRLGPTALGLKGEELQRALAFEAEPLSGIGAFESELAYEQVSVEGGEREFRVALLRTADLEMMRDAVARTGSQLIGVLHADPPATVDGAEPDLVAWLAAWGERLAKGDGSNVLTLKPPRRPMSSERRALLAVGLMAVIAALCLGHHFLSERAQAETRAELQRVDGEVKRLETLTAEARACDTQREELHRKTQAFELSTKALTTQQARLARLLEQLAERKSEAVLIRHIDCAGGEPCLKGWAMDPDGAFELARSIARIAGPLGWEVQPPSSTALAQLSNGGPWEFELRLRDLLPLGDFTAKKGTKTAKETP